MLDGKVNFQKENSKDLKENQKQKLKKKIEELQSEYERLH